MNCRRVSHLLSAYMDGELNGMEHQQIHAHLAECAACAAEHRNLVQVKQLLGAMRVQEPRAALPVEIIERVHAGESARSTSRPAPLWQRPVPTYALASVGVVLAFGLASLRPAPSRMSPPIIWKPATTSDAPRFSAASAQAQNDAYSIPMGWPPRRYVVPVGGDASSVLQPGPVEVGNPLSPWTPPTGWQTLR